jgi:hypothetical protein
MADNFSNHPQSITEIKAERYRDATVWTPRDALISALRDYDDGKIKTDTLLICYAEVTEDGKDTCRGYQAYKSKFKFLGLMQDYMSWFNSPTEK